MSVEDEARAEVNRRHPWWHDNGVGIVQGSHYRSGFVDGAEWQAFRTVEEVQVEAEDHLTVWRVLADPENGVPNLSKSEQKLERKIRRDAEMYVSGANAILRMFTPVVCTCYTDEKDTK